MISQLAGDVASAFNWSDLHLSPVALDLGFFKLRWYSLAYIAMILIGWRYLVALIARPGAPMARRHADDFVTYATLGIILGGRIGYVLFYRPDMLETPLDVLKLWEGGMSFHGGLIGVLIALVIFAQRKGLNFLRVCDYVATVAPVGPLLVRPANFVNGELWGRPTGRAWGMIFPGAGPQPRHPSQLYEMALEGLLLLVVMAFLFFRTDARYYPGRLFGSGLIGYGLARTALETVRQPDAGLEHLAWGLTMGQTLSIPMIIGGFYLVMTSKARRVRVEPIAGSRSVA